eukprot:386346-Pelagomonas_calceolata.AAC.2
MQHTLVTAGSCHYSITDNRTDCQWLCLCAPVGVQQGCQPIPLSRVCLPRRSQGKGMGTFYSILSRQIVVIAESWLFGLVIQEAMIGALVFGGQDEKGVAIGLQGCRAEGV